MKKKKNKTGFVLGIVGLLTGLFVPLIGFILGLIGFYKSDNSNDKVLNISAMAVSIVSWLITFFYILYF